MLTAVPAERSARNAQSDVVLSLHGTSDIPFRFGVSRILFHMAVAKTKKELKMAP